MPVTRERDALSRKPEPVYSVCFRVDAAVPPSILTLDPASRTAVTTFVDPEELALTLRDAPHCRQMMIIMLRDEV